MRMPLSFRPEFIGKLIAMQGSYRERPEIFERLCVAVQQCRGYNGADHEERSRLVPLMERTRKELRERGVIVGIGG